MKNNKVIKSIMLVLVLMIITVIGGTFAYWQWITATEQETLVNVSLTDDATIYIDFPDNEITNMYPTSDCEANGTSSWVTDITVNNGTGVKLATNFKLKIKIEDKDGNVITNGTNEWNAQPFRYYIKYAVTEENESCQNALIKGRFDSDVLTYANVASNDPHYGVKNDWYDSTSITKKGTDGFPIVSSRIDSGVSFHALPNRETSHTYKVWVWLDKDYTSVTVGNDSTLDKLQDAKITVSWSENSELEQIRESATPIGEAIAIYSEDDNSLRFYRETNPSSVTVGSTYNGRTVTSVYKDFENSNNFDFSPGGYSKEICDERSCWFEDVYYEIDKIIFEDYIYLISTNYLFFDTGGFANNVIIDVTKLDVSNVTDMSAMFLINSSGYMNITIFGLETWDTSNVINMNRMFNDTTSEFNEEAVVFNIKGDLRSWNVCNVTEYEEFINNDRTIQPYFGDPDKCNGGNPAPNYNPMAGEAIAIFSTDDYSLRFYREEDIDSVTVGSTYNGRTVTAVITDFEDSVYTAYDQVPWSNLGGYNDEDIGSWISYSYYLKEIVFEDYVYPKSTSYWFNDMNSANALSIDVTKLDVSSVTDMSYMFSNVNNSASITGLEKWNTSNVTDMEGMFENSYFAEELDLSIWNVCRVTEYESFGDANSRIASPYFGDSTKCNGGNPA